MILLLIIDFRDRVDVFNQNELTGMPLFESRRSDDHVIKFYFWVKSITEHVSEAGGENLYDLMHAKMGPLFLYEYR